VNEDEMGIWSLVEDEKTLAVLQRGEESYKIHRQDKLSDLPGPGLA
jgi:hypothetical protein